MQDLNDSHCGYTVNLGALRTVDGDSCLADTIVNSQIAERLAMYRFCDACGPKIEFIDTDGFDHIRKHKGAKPDKGRICAYSRWERVAASTYTIIAVVEDGHFSLLIVCHPGAFPPHDD